MYTREITLKVLNVGLFSDDPRRYQIHCQHCPNKNDSKGLIIEKITQSVINPSSGVVGHNSSQEKNTTSVYFCNKCGVVFIPTRHNKFGILHEERLKKAETLFESTTDSYYFSADLAIDQIIEIGNKDKQPFIDVNDFKKDTEVWFYKANNSEQGQFFSTKKTTPHIVNDEEGKRIVFYETGEKVPLPPIALWAEKIYHPVLDKDFWIIKDLIEYRRNK